MKTAKRIYHRVTMTKRQLSELKRAQKKAGYNDLSAFIREAALSKARGEGGGVLVPGGVTELQRVLSEAKQLIDQQKKQIREYERQEKWEKTHVHPKLRTPRRTAVKLAE